MQSLRWITVLLVFITYPFHTSLLVEMSRPKNKTSYIKRISPMDKEQGNTGDNKPFNNTAINTLRLFCSAGCSNFLSFFIPYKN